MNETPSYWKVLMLGSRQLWLRPLLWSYFKFMWSWPTPVFFSYYMYTCFWASWPRKCMFWYITRRVYNAIKNHRIHVTNFFVLMTTIWWPHGVWKVVNLFLFSFFFELPDQKNVCLICHKYIARKKDRRCSHDHINLKYNLYEKKIIYFLLFGPD